MSQPTTPGESNDVGGPPPANGVAAALEKAISNGATSPTSINTATTATPGSTPASPTAGSAGSPHPFRRGHGRQASLGTTMTSPSTRRRSLESTMSLLKEAADGKEADAEFEQLADQVAGMAKGQQGQTTVAAKENAVPR